MAEHLYTYINPPAEKHLERACQILAADGVLCVPAGTSWAFACDAASVKALDQIRLLNPSHPKDRPFSLACSTVSMAAEYGQIDHRLYRLIRKVWPGPFTILLNRNRSLVRQLKDKRPVVGIRIPESPLLLALIEKFGRPLAVTSLPHRKDDQPYRAGYEVFESYGHGIDLLLDLGDELTGQDSTVVDCSGDEPVLIRRGAGDPALFGLEDKT